MNAHFIIDWISFSCPVEWTHWTQFSLDAFMSLSEHLPGVPTLINFARFDRRADVPARRPYRATLVHPESGARMYYNLDLSHILFEIPGQACQWVRERTSMPMLISSVASRVTRLDVALDIQTEATPGDVLAACAGAPTRSQTQISSDMGETIYLGSPRSERFVRVYRYNDPHPRAGVLRVEFIARRDFAKALAKAIADSGLQSVGASLLERYGLDVALYVFAGDAREVDLSLPAESREHSRTLFWLNKQVAPALIKLARAGALNPREWLESEVISRLGLTVDDTLLDNWE